MTDHTTMQGQVLAVEHEPQGGVALSWAGTELLVQNAADFNREGGQFVVEGDPRVFTYTGVTEAPGDEDENAPDTVHTDETAPVTITEETAVYIWPEALEVTAQVATDDTPDGVQATVPHNLRAQLVPGVREPAAREWVRLELHGHEWLVADVVGRRAVVQADAVEGLNDRLAELQERLDQSAQELQAAKDALAAKAGTEYQDRAPTADDPGTSGDAWWQLDSSGHAVGLWRHDGATWVPMDLGAQVLAADQVLAERVSGLLADFRELYAQKITADMLNVDQALAQKLQAVVATFQDVFAGTITADMVDLDTLAGKVLNGVDIYSPHQSSLPRVHVGGATIETVRGYAEEDGAVREVVGISLGGPTADKMQLLNPDGGVLAGFDTDGSGRSSDFAAEGDITATGKVTADAADFGTLSIGPYPDLADELRNRPRGVIARQRLGSSASGNGVRFGSSYLGYYELFFAPGDQLTKVTYAGHVYADGPGYYAVRLVATSDPDPDVIPASPNLPRGNYATIAFCGLQASTRGLYPIHLEGWVQPYSGSYRVMLAAAVPSGGPSGYVWSTDSEPSWMVAESVGSYTGFADGGYNRGGGTPYTGSATVTETAPVAVRRTYTSTWQATGVATYREGVGSMSTSRYLLQQGTYGGKNRRSHAVFNGGAVSGEKGRTIAQALSGATVSRVEFWGLVKDTHNNAGGTAVLAPAIPTELTSISTSTAESRFSGWKAGTAKWVTLSNALGNRTRSVAIGPDSSGLTEYIKFDPTLANLKLRITYTR